MSTIAPNAETDAFTTQELTAWRGLLEIHAGITNALDEQMRVEHGLPVSSYEVLMFLADAPDHRLRMSEIADRVLLSRSGLTRLVDRLVQLGYASRCAVETDGRGAYAELTEAGLQKLEAARRTHRAGVRRYFLDRLSAADQIALGGIWTRLRASNA
jgi:DNA-binding MarR family transcriptional regulator